MSYYYLVASLPALVVGSAPALSPQQFRVLCSEHLEPRHLTELDAVLSGGGTSTLARRWQQTQRRIAYQCAKARAQRHAVEPASLTPPDGVPDLTLVRAVQDALAAGDPKGRELQLDMLRLAALDSSILGVPFELDAVLAYGLRLQICARWAARTPARGRANLTAQVEATLQRFDLRGGES